MSLRPWVVVLVAVGVVAPALLSSQTPQLITTTIRFSDVTAAAGIDFVHSGGSGGLYRYVEQLGGGAAFLDYDGDGWLDVFLAQGAPLAGFTGEPPAGNRLYRNDGDGTFTDVTAAAGLTSTRFTLGVASADYDNDGDADLAVTSPGGAQLYRNDGSRFVDVTTRAGIAVDQLPASLSFLDYDRDGWLDLFIARYGRYDVSRDAGCPDFSAATPGGTGNAAQGGIRMYCAPGDIPAETGLLFRNRGDGAFTDVTAAAGIDKAAGHGLGVAVADYNEDGWPDIFVASDLLPNLLFINTRKGGFEERALMAGVAVGPEGKAYAGMGVDTSDYDNDGHMDLFITNFEGETSSLYRGMGDGTFSDESRRSGIATLSKAFLKWGCGFVDLDRDGRLDLFIVNGHVDVAGPRREQRAQIYANAGGGRFISVEAAAGRFFQQRHWSRGAAFGDYDNDGDTDVLITNNKARAVLLRNDTPPAARWAGLALQGERLNRDALGAVIRVTSGGITQTRTVKSGGSYLSDHDRRLLFALPGSEPATAEIRWPCGAVQKVPLRNGSTTTVKEEGCLLTRRPAAGKR